MLLGLHLYSAVTKLRPDWQISDMLDRLKGKVRDILGIKHNEGDLNMNLSQSLLLLERQETKKVKSKLLIPVLFETLSFRWF